MTCGVYRIENKTNGKLYIGSSKNIEGRWKTHVAGKGNSHLFNAIKKYGKENFEFKVLVECSEEVLLNREQYYLDEYMPEYNKSIVAGRIILVGEAKNKWLKKIQSPEYRSNMSKIKKGVVFTEEHKTKISLSQIGNTRGRGGKGKIISEDQRKKISIANTGRKASEETRHKMSIARQGRTPMLGHKHSDKTKQKMAAKRKGRTPALGMKHTAEWIENKSKQMKEYWERKHSAPKEKEGVL